MWQQWNNGYVMCKDYEKKDKFVSSTHGIRIDQEGNGYVMLDVSLMTLITIGIENTDYEPIEVQVSVSPNGCIYKNNGDPIKVKENNGFELCTLIYFLKYAVVAIKGRPGAVVYVYMQGQC